MKRVYAFGAAVAMALAMAGCFPSPQTAAPAASQPMEQPAAVGERVEQFGFVFAIPQGTTGHGLDDGVYDIDFGEIGEREAFIGINPPEDMSGMGVDEEELLPATLEDMRRVVFDTLDDISNDVVEMREIDGHSAGYIGLDCTMSGLPVYWQMYIVVEDDTLYSFTIQIFSDAITDETRAVLDRFAAEIQLA